MILKSAICEGLTKGRILYFAVIVSLLGCATGSSFDNRLCKLCFIDRNDTNDNYLFRAYADAVYPEDGESAEKQRVQWLADEMSSLGYSPETYFISKREVSIDSEGLFADISSIRYFIVAERSSRVPVLMDPFPMDEYMRGLECLMQLAVSQEDLRRIVWPDSVDSIVSRLRECKTIFQSEGDATNSVNHFCVSDLLVMYPDVYSIECRRDGSNSCVITLRTGQQFVFCINNNDVSLVDPDSIIREGIVVIGREYAANMREECPDSGICMSEEPAFIIMLSLIPSCLQSAE